MSGKQTNERPRVDKLEELVYEIQKLNGINDSIKHKIKSGFFSGLASGVGTIVGFVIVIIVLFYLTVLIGRVPLLSDYYEGSALKKVIDYQLSRIENEEEQNQNDGEGSEGENESTEDTEEVRNNLSPQPTNLDQ